MLNIKKTITKILTGMTTKAGTFTPTQGGMTNALNVHQYGDIVTINGYLNNVTLTTNSNTNIGSISNVDVPTEPVRFICSVGSNAYTMGTHSYGTVTKTGVIEITSSAGGSGKALFFTATYNACTTLGGVISRIKYAITNLFREGVMAC